MIQAELLLIMKFIHTSQNMNIDRYSFNLKYFAQASTKNSQLPNMTETKNLDNEYGSHTTSPI